MFARSKKSILLPMLLLPLATGCASMGNLEQILNSLGGGITGEIRQIDGRRQEIEVQSNSGSYERVRYDGRTEVVYRNRQYAIRDLEIGDYVRIRLDPTRGTDYAETIEVQESYSGGRSPNGGNVSRGVQRFDGSVAQIDTRSGWFEIEETRGGRILVTLPYQANRTLLDRFQRMRRGDRVRIEGEMLNNSRMELHRFL